MTDNDEELPPFTPQELWWLEEIRSMEVELPSDDWALPAAQEIACILAKEHHNLSAESKAFLVGCGAVLLRHARHGMEAELLTSQVLTRARGKLH